MHSENDLSMLKNARGTKVYGDVFVYRLKSFMYLRKLSWWPILGYIVFDILL
jgi:hypothetical protein